MLCSWIATMVIDTARRLVQTGLGPTGWNHNVFRRPKRRTYWSTRAEGEHTGYHILNEWAPRGGYCSIEPQQRAHYIHVDDGVILGTQKEKELVNEDMNRAADALGSVGFVVKDRTPAGELESVVGYDIVAGTAELRVSAERAGLLREALRWTGAGVGRRRPPGHPAGTMGVGSLAEARAPVGAAGHLQVLRALREAEGPVVATSQR